MDLSVFKTALVISLLMPIAGNASSKNTSFTKGEQLIVSVYDADKQRDVTTRAEFLSIDEFNSEVTVKILNRIPYLTRPVMEFSMDRIFRTKGCVGNASDKVCVGERVTFDYQIQNVVGVNIASGTLALSRPKTENSSEKLTTGVHHLGGIGLMRGCAEGFCVGDKIGILYAAPDRVPVGGIEYAEVISIDRIGHGGLVYFWSARGLDFIRPHTISDLEFIEYAPGFPADSSERGELHKRLQ